MMVAFAEGSLCFLLSPLIRAAYLGPLAHLHSVVTFQVTVLRPAGGPEGLQCKGLCARTSPRVRLGESRGWICKGLERGQAAPPRRSILVPPQQVVWSSLPGNWIIQGAWAL